MKHLATPLAAKVAKASCLPPFGLRSTCFYVVAAQKKGNMQKPSCSCSFAPLNGPLAAREQKCEFLYQRLTQNSATLKGGSAFDFGSWPPGFKSGRFRSTPLTWNFTFWPRAPRGPCGSQNRKNTYVLKGALGFIAYTECSPLKHPKLIHKMFG